VLSGACIANWRPSLRIAIVGPFSGPSLAGQFVFPRDAGALPPGYPGAPLMAILAKVLVDRGHFVGAITTDYFTPIERLEPYRKYEAKQVSAYFCPQRRHSFRVSSGKRGRALDLFAYERQGLVAAIKDFAPDVIHAHWTYEFVWAALDSGYPVLATAHDSPKMVVRHMPNLYRTVRYFMARRVLQRCKYLTAVSPDLADDIQRMARTPVTVVPNPISTTTMSVIGCTDAAFDSRTLVTVLNGWTRLKNGTLALASFKLARQVDSSLRLVCFGSGFEHGGPAHRWAKKNALDEGVHFRGPVPHETIIAEMQSATALLHPSRVEACSVTIAEAMTVGLPTIAGRHTGGVAWQLDGGGAGILADVTDRDDVARKIVELTCDIERWRRISMSARTRARELFSIDRILDQYLSLYLATIESNLAPLRMYRGTSRSVAGEHVS
jgi:L-malate glycosyltransferase